MRRSASSTRPSTRIGVGSSYSTDFHDITSGTSGSYSAVTGYDLVTGWGSPNGTGLINALAGIVDLAQLHHFRLAHLGLRGTGSSGTSTITTTVSGGFNSAIACPRPASRPA